MREDILRKIVAVKAERLREEKSRIPERHWRELAEKKAGGRSGNFSAALRADPQGSPRIIAEVKRGSPSKGLMRPDLDVVKTVSAYEAGGAAALSVLTERDFFHARDDDFSTARSSTDLPLLRKDFMWDPYQIYQSVAWGADAVLLIVRILSDDQLKDLIDLCRELGVDALVETHDEEEIERAVNSGAYVVGINNRDLKTFEVSVETTVRLAGLVDKKRHLVVCESGIKSPDDIRRVRDAGVHAFLVGEYLVRSGDPVSALRALLVSS
ncbi:indole-3-glycerol phosphate synthase TrpC [Thermodesulforhabdus norvegica]|uniref:Indole-3-glycerol phosphate synthase n=1 Tax=Thermodesulforhabdus norvegica TaxID=39841 RepID=A0A1I4U728_9BACT|nr:indole-3-glycerol phosphate synthase TrpC [Thermodesulforhabdus norvegica]SFM84621.1 indole-3-glycerol phosphate synthase [Thermodesulforhabdus norvegica]